jgi:hypothetical protein
MGPDPSGSADVIMLTDILFWWILITGASVAYDLMSYEARVKRAQGKKLTRADAWWAKLLGI